MTDVNVDADDAVRVNERAEEVLERIDDAFFAVDDQWRFTFLNERAERFLEVEEAAVVGENVWEVFEPAVGTTFQHEYERAMATQEPVSFQEYYAPLETWFEVSAYPSETGLSVYFRDVTDRVERERELERYETIVETARDGVYVVDDEGRFRMVNDAYCELTGYDREELLGAHVSLVVDEETSDAASRIEGELRDGTDPTASLEANLQRKDGSRVRAEATFSLLPSGDRVGVVRDVTERKERERQLELYERIVETVEDGVYAVDGDGEFLLVNDAFCEMSGYEREELLGRSAGILYDGDLAADVERLIDEMEAGERETATLELDMITKDGDEVPVETRFEPFPLGEGIGRCGVVRDVSERKEREAELRKRVAQQEVVTDLGRRALADQDLDALMADAARLVAETLDNDYCKVLDLDAEDEELLLRRGVGWHDGIVGSATVSAVEDDSQAAYTLASEEPVVVEDLETETRFSGPDLLTNHDVRSGISTVIGPADGPWGILGTHDTAVRTFSDQDVNFVQSVANVLASAIKRNEDEAALRNQRDRLAALNDINSLVHGLSESLFGLSTKEDIERLVCERLADSESYAFAWVGTVDDGEVTVEREAGVEGYLDDLTLRVDEEPGVRGPTATAHRTGEMQVVRDVENDPQYDPWRERARDFGYRASASVPLVDGGEMRGTLNVYADRRGAFNAEERDALRRLGSIITYAIQAVERDRELQRERNRTEFMNRLLRHNLLNSLNVVEARLDILDGRVDYEVADHLETAIDRTRGMIDFVETVREVTRVLGEDGEQELRPVDLGEALATRVDRARGSYPEATFHFDSTPGVDVVADDLLGEVLDNVLANAVQHNPKASPTVWVDTAVHDDEVVVSVADDGPGVPDEQKASVFDRESRGFDDPGTGFGLYLVREIVASYGGDVAVADNDPEGAVFRLVFERA